MPSETLREVLAILKDAKVLRAHVKLEGLEIGVEYQFDAPAAPAVGANPVPGGWKTLEVLDAPWEPEASQ